MALFRLSTLLLLVILSALGVLANGPGLDMAYKAIGSQYWFEDVWTSENADKDDDDVQAAARRGFYNAEAVADRTGIRAPSIVAALWVPYEGTIVASSIRTPGQWGPSAQTCNIISWPHRNNRNCAEVNAVAIANDKSWTIRRGAKMAVYGRTRRSGKGFTAPCDVNHNGVDGCKRFLRENPNIELVNPYVAAPTPTSTLRVTDVSRATETGHGLRPRLRASIPSSP